MTMRTSKAYQTCGCCASSVAACTSAVICTRLGTALLAVSLFALLRIMMWN